MTATMKSRVLAREEKGIGGVPMKRLIFCGMGGGIVYLFVRLTPLQPLSLPLLALVSLILVFMTGTRFGVPRYAWLLLGWRGRLMLDAHLTARPLPQQMCEALSWDPATVMLHSLDLFHGAERSQKDADLSGLQVLTGETGEGYEVLTDDHVRMGELA